MSVEPGTKHAGGPPAAPQSLDLTGLPGAVADELRRLVAALRENLGPERGPRTSLAGESPDQWARSLQAWVDTHPARSVAIDDDREGLYADRGA